MDWLSGALKSAENAAGAMMTSGIALASEALETASGALETAEGSVRSLASTAADAVASAAANAENLAPLSDPLPASTRARAPPLPIRQELLASLAVNPVTSADGWTVDRVPPLAAP